MDGSTHTSSATYSALIPLLIAAFVVVRFALRELKERVVRSPAIWIRPVILIAVTIGFIVATFALVPSDGGLAIVSVVVGAALGVLTGWGIVSNTTFRSAGLPKAVRVKGSRLTLGIWIAALVVRFAARIFYPHATTSAAQLPLNAGTFALIGAAFLVIALAFQREIQRFAPVDQGAP